MSDKTGTKVAEQVRRQTERAPRQEVLPQPANADDPQDEQFPTDGYTVTDKRDMKYDMIQALQDPEHPGITKFGAVKYSDDVLDWIQKKRDADVKRGFEQWFAKNFDLMSPAQKAWAREMYPNFYRDRKRMIKENTKLLGDLARIRLMGVQTKEDLMLQYAADSGMIDMQPIENILHPRHPNENDDNAFLRGLANPRAWTPGALGIPANNQRAFRERDNVRLGYATAAPLPAEERMSAWGRGFVNDL